MFFHTLYQQASLIALLTACGTALWRGGWVERTAAAAMIVAWIATGPAYHNGQKHGPQYGVMAVDLALLAVLVFLALRSDRWWPLWASAFHALGSVLHIAVAADPKVFARAYFVAGSIFSYLTMAALLVGALRRPRRGGGEPPPA